MKFHSNFTNDTAIPESALHTASPSEAEVRALKLLLAEAYNTLHRIGYGKQNGPYSAMYRIRDARSYCRRNGEVVRKLVTP